MPQEFRQRVKHRSHTISRVPNYVPKHRCIVRARFRTVHNLHREIHHTIVHGHVRRCADGGRWAPLCPPSPLLLHTLPRVEHLAGIAALACPNLSFVPVSTRPIPSEHLPSPSPSPFLRPASPPICICFCGRCCCSEASEGVSAAPIRLETSRCPSVRQMVGTYRRYTQSRVFHIKRHRIGLV